jgi:type II secretory pathway component PulF
MDTWFPTLRRFFGQRISLPFAWPWYSTRSQRRGLLRMIAVAIEERIPIAPLLSAWLDDARGTFQHRLARLGELLDQGVPLADAIEQVPGILHDEDVLAIRFDAQSGTATRAIRDRLAQPSAIAAEGSPRIRSTMYYLCAVLLLGFPIVAFVQIKIVPAFREIFSEFSLDLPPVTYSFLAFSNLFTRFLWVPGLLLVALLLSFIFARPGRAVRHAVGRFFAPLRRQHRANLLRLIAIATSAGRPIAGALSTLARYHFDPAIRHKLLFVRNEMEQGASPWESMNEAGLLSSADVRALHLADRIGNRPWVLTQLADVKKRRAGRWIDRLSEFVLPAVVLAMGLFVLFQALALFSPLVNLIHRLAA